MIEALAALAKVSLTYVEPEVDPITYLERISLTYVGPVAGQDDHPIREAVIRTAKYVAGKGRALWSFVRTAFVHDERIQGRRPRPGLDQLEPDLSRRPPCRVTSKRSASPRASTPGSSAASGGPAWKRSR